MEFLDGSTARIRSSHRDTKSGGHVAEFSSEVKDGIL